MGRYGGTTMPDRVQGGTAMGRGAARLWRAATCALALALISGSALGASYTWDGSNNDNWSKKQNWTPMSGNGGPVAGDTVTIATEAGGICLIDGADRACAVLTVQNAMSLRAIQNLVDLTVSGNVTVNSGGTIVVGSGGTCILYVGGNWNNNGSFSYNIGGGDSGTVNFNNSGNIDHDGSGGTGSGNFWNVIVSGTHTLTSNVTVDNDLTVSGTLNLNGYTLTVKGNATISGTLSVGGGVLSVEGNLDTTGGTLNNNTGTVNLKGSFTSGTYNRGTGTFNYNGTTQNITGVSYYDLQVTGSTATLADSSTVVNNTFVVDSTGKIRLSNFTMTFASGASITVNGTIESGGGTLTSSGAGAYFGITFNGTVNIGSMSVTRPDDNGVTISSGATVTRLDNITYASGQNGASSRYLYMGQGSGAVSFVGHVIDANCNVNVTAPSGIKVAMIDSSGAKGGVTNGEANDGAIDANITWANPITWQGDDATSPTLWSVAENWNTGVVPSGDAVITIPNVANQPTVDVDAECYTLTIQNGATVSMSVANKTLEIRGRKMGGRLQIDLGGTLSMTASGTVFKCGGIWDNSGTFTASAGTVVFHSQAVDQDVPVETFNNLEIDKLEALTATATGALTINGNLTVTLGTFNLGNYTHTVSSTTDVFGKLMLVAGSDITCSGKVTVKAGGELNMNGACFLRLSTNGLAVDDGAIDGTFIAAGSTPTVTWDGANRYAFAVSGAINVTALNMSYYDASGLTVNDGALITAIDNINFTNGVAATGRHLRVLDLGTTVYFSSGCVLDNTVQNNVYVPAASGITLNMVGTSGAFGGATNGEANDDDTGNHINWYDEKSWQGASGGPPSNRDKWNVTGNWSPTGVPTAADYVRIIGPPTSNRQCYVNVAGATCKGIVIDGTSSGVLYVTGAGNALTVGEYFRIQSGGTVNLNNEDSLTVGGNWTNDGTFTLQSGTTSGTLIFNGTTIVDKATGSAGTETFDNLTVSGIMTITNGDSVTALGTFNPTGATINAGTGTTLTTTGSWTAAPTTFNYGTSTVVLKGTANVPAVTYYNLTIDGACTLTADVTVKNNLIINNTASLNLGAFTITVEGNVTNSGTLDLDTGRIKAKNTFTSTGTFTAGAGTVEFNGTTQTIPNPGNYYNIDVNGSTVTLAAGVTVNNQFNVFAGTLALGSSTLTFANGGALDVDGVITCSGGTLASTGAGSYFGINIDGTINADGLTVNRPNDNGLTIQNTATIQALDSVTYTNGQNGAASRYLWIGHASGSYNLTGHSFDANHNWNVVAPNGASIAMVSATEGKGTTDPEDYDGTVDANITWTDAHIWQGDDATNPTLWNVAENWDKGTVPEASDAVIIPSATNDPVLNVNGQCATLTIQSGGLLTMSTASTTLTVSGNVTVSSGGTLTMSSATTTLKAGGSWLRSGTFNANAGTVSFYSTTADQTIPAETFNHLEINKSGKEALLGGNIVLNGNLTLTSGTLDLGTGSCFVTGTTDIYGKLEVNAGGTLNASGSAAVKAGGELYMNGSSTIALGASLSVDSGGTNGKFTALGLTPTVTWNGSTRYAFTVNGTIEIDALNLNYPNADGLTINDGATIVDIDNLDCNNGLSTGTYLRVQDTSTTTYSFAGCDFDSNCQYNVAAAIVQADKIVMIGATGAKAGEGYDNDPGTTIKWENQKIWDGSTNSNWSEPTNWSGNSVPIATDNVFIGTAANPCNVNVATAQCQTLEVGSGGTLIIDAGTDLLTVAGSITVSSGATLTLSSGELRSTGDWTSNESVIASGGLVTLNAGASQAIAGTVIPTLYNLTVTNSSTVTLNTNITVSNVLSVAAGSQVTVSSGKILSLSTSTTLSGTLVLSTNSKLRMASGTTFTANTGSTFTVSGTSQQAGGYATIEAVSGAYSMTLAGNVDVTFARFYDLNSNGVTLSAASTTTIFDNVLFYDGAAGATPYLRVTGAAWNGHNFYGMGFSDVGGTKTRAVEITTGGTVTLSQYGSGAGWLSGDATDMETSGTITWAPTAAEGLEARVQRTARGTLVTWSAAGERGTAGYRVLRRRVERHSGLLEEEAAGAAPRGERIEKFRGAWCEVDRVPVRAPGGEPGGQRYRFHDKTSPGKCEYLIEEVEGSGRPGRRVRAVRGF